MRQALRLFALLLRAYLRDRTALFFSLIVPLMLMVIFGYLNLGDFGRVTLAIDDQAKNQSSAQILQIVKGIETFQVTELRSRCCRPCGARTAPGCSRARPCERSGEPPSPSNPSGTRTCGGG